MIYNTNSSGIPGVYDTVGGDTPQLLKINGDQLSITNGNAITLPSGGGASLPYALYSADLFQSGTSNPTIVNTHYNDVGAIVWTRTGVGEYRGTLTGALPVSKTSVMLTQQVLLGGDNDWFVTGIADISGNYIRLKTYDDTGTPSEGLNHYIEIKVYP